MESTYPNCGCPQVPSGEMTFVVSMCTGGSGGRDGGGAAGGVGGEGGGVGGGGGYGITGGGAGGEGGGGWEGTGGPGGHSIFVIMAVPHCCALRWFRPSNT